MGGGELGTDDESADETDTFSGLNNGVSNGDSIGWMICGKFRDKIGGDGDGDDDEAV